MVRAQAIYKKVTEVDTEASTYTYQMATEQLDDLELLEETTLPEQEPKKLLPAKKKPGPHNSDQNAKFVVETLRA